MAETEAPAKKKRKKEREPAKPGYRLYSPAAVFAHTFLFSPLMGGYLVSQNYRRAGEEAKAKKALWVAVVATLAVIAAGYLLDRFIGRAAQGGVAGATGAMAMTWYREQKAMFQRHLDAGGERASVVPTAFAGLGVAGVFVGFAIFGMKLDHTPADFDKGVALMKAGRHAEAAKAFRDVLKAEPAAADARYNLALALFCIDDNETATSELGKIPSDAEIYPRAHAVLERAKSARVLGWALMKDHCY